MANDWVIWVSDSSPIPAWFLCTISLVCFCWARWRDPSAAHICCSLRTRAGQRRVDQPAPRGGLLRRLQGGPLLRALRRRLLQPLLRRAPPRPGPRGRRPRRSGTRRGAGPLRQQQQGLVLRDLRRGLLRRAVRAPQRPRQLPHRRLRRPLLRSLHGLRAVVPRVRRYRCKHFFPLPFHDEYNQCC